MSADVTEVDSGYGKQDKAADLQRAASDIVSTLHSKVKLVGNVVALKNAEALGPEAYKADDVGISSFAMYSNTYSWYQREYYEGMLEGHGSLTIPDSHYLLWLFKDGALYLKWVEGSYEQMKEGIRFERIEMRKQIYWAALKANFLQLLARIQLDKIV